MSFRTFRGLSYAALVTEMDAWGKQSKELLIAQIGRPAITSLVAIEGQLITIDVVVCWADAKQNRIRIDGVASGSNCLNLERIEERIFIKF